MIPSNLWDVRSPRKLSGGTLEKWVDRIDVLLFVETPIIDRLVTIAKRRGKKIVCIPMHENIPTYEDWPSLVDLWIAPTQHTVEVLKRKKVRGNVVYFPCPVDANAFDFQPRTVCRRFIYAQGNSGPKDRKGGLIVRAALEIDPDLPVAVYSQVQDGIYPGYHIPVDWSGVADFRGSVVNPADIYRDGDVFVMPSRWEGLGLPLYECQAAGMPLICTNGPPMNEAHPWKTIPAILRRFDIFNKQRHIESWDVTPEDLVTVLRASLGQDITQASKDARKFAVERSWASSADSLRHLIARDE